MYTWQYTIQWTLTNPNSLGSELIQISESFGLVNELILNGGWLYFYLMHLKMAMNIIDLGVRISEGPLYYDTKAQSDTYSLQWNLSITEPTHLSKKLVKWP